MVLEPDPLRAEHPEEEIGHLEDQATGSSVSAGYRASSRDSFLGLLLLEKQLLVCALQAVVGGFVNIVGSIHC